MSPEPVVLDLAQVLDSSEAADGSGAIIRMRYSFWTVTHLIPWQPNPSRFVMPSGRVYEITDAWSQLRERWIEYHGRPVSPAEVTR